MAVKFQNRTIGRTLVHVECMESASEFRFGTLTDYAMEILRFCVPNPHTFLNSFGAAQCKLESHDVKRVQG